MPVAKWLMKSEPESFGYDDLVRVKREGWDGVRNYQARNFLRAMAKGDEVIFYHSNANPPGRGRDRQGGQDRRARPDPVRPGLEVLRPRVRTRPTRAGTGSPSRPSASCKFVSIDELRTMPELVDCRLLARGNRLSVMPLTDAEFDAIVAYSKTKTMSAAMSDPATTRADPPGPDPARRVDVSPSTA